MIVHVSQASIDFQNIFKNFWPIFSNKCICCCYFRYFDEINDDLEQDLDSDSDVTCRPTPSKFNHSVQPTPISDIVVKNNVPLDFVTHL